MASLYLVAKAAFVAGRDAVVPHLARFSESSCQFLALSTNVHAGRTQAVCTSRRGPACCEALQEHRSRGCRALRLFCLWSWLPSWQLAPVTPRKRSSTLTNRSRSSRPTPANTTKRYGRAKGAIAPRPALFLSDALASGRLSGVAPFVLGAKQRYGEALATFFCLEILMRKSAVIALVALATLAACAKPAPEPEPMPVTVEPAPTGKYGS